MSTQQLRGNMPKLQTIGEFVLEWRLKKGLGQKEVAALIGKTKAYVGFIEQDKYAYPIEFIKALHPHMTKAEREEAYLVLCQKLKQDLES